MKIRARGKQKIESPPMTFGQSSVAVGLFAWAYGSSFGFDEDTMDLDGIELKSLANERTIVAHGVSKENVFFAQWIMMLIARLVGASQGIHYDDNIPEKKEAGIGQYVSRIKTGLDRESGGGCLCAGF